MSTVEAGDLESLFEDLKGNIDDLENALAPLLSSTVADVASKLPLLDKAKLQVMVTYAIESLLFSILKLNDVDAREHPVFRELARVKQYFEKIKEAETSGPKQRTMAIDKGAASRFIKHALSGNDKMDGRMPNSHIKFEDTSDQVGTAQRFKHLSKKRKADESGPSTPTTPAADTPEQASEATSDEMARLERKRLRKEKKERSLAAEATGNGEREHEPAKPEQPKRERSHKKDKSHKSHKPPKASKEIFQDLLNRPSPAKDSKKARSAG